MVNDLFDEKTWEDFREAGMLWAVNEMLEHLFGWCIVYDYQSNSELRVVPCKTSVIGFDEKAEKEGREKLIRYLKACDDNGEEQVCQDSENSIESKDTEDKFEKMYFKIMFGEDD